MDRKNMSFEVYCLTVEGVYHYNSFTEEEYKKFYDKFEKYISDTIEEDFRSIN